MIKRFWRWLFERNYCPNCKAPKGEAGWVLKEVDGRFVYVRCPVCKSL
jgi:phage FluMu protein Com